MPRPIKKGLDYFPHDTDAVNDNKVQSMMALYGMEGYAFYFILLEMIFRSENGHIPMGKLLDKVGITRIMGITIDKFDEILASALEIGCFNKEKFEQDKQITSNGIMKRIAKVNEIRLKERERKLHIKEKINIKRKGKLPTENHRFPVGKLIIPTIQEVTDYCLDRKNTINPQKWHDFYTAKNWMIGKNKMKDWKAAIRTWESNDKSVNEKKVCVYDNLKPCYMDCNKCEIAKKYKDGRMET